MIARADPPPSELARPPARHPDRADTSVATPRPRLALFVASVCGLGYIPIAPGTFGSLAGLLLVGLPWFAWRGAIGIAGPSVLAGNTAGGRVTIPLVAFSVAVLTAAIGVWSAHHAAAFWHENDPQRVVIDEVSGQHLAVLLGVAAPLWRKPTPMVFENFGPIPLSSLLSWKYLLVGFILFRVFDIWKPFPVRQAESLPGGWGIMTDDWVAGVYAAIGLWIARALGL